MNMFFFQDVVLMRALRDMNLPKFVFEDVPLFLGLISDLFPGLDCPRVRYPDFNDAVESILQENNYVLLSHQVDLCIIILSRTCNFESLWFEQLSHSNNFTGTILLSPYLNSNSVSNDLFDTESPQNKSLECKKNLVFLVDFKLLSYKGRQSGADVRDNDDTPYNYDCRSNRGRKICGDQHVVSSSNQVRNFNHIFFIICSLFIDHLSFWTKVCRWIPLFWYASSISCIFVAYFGISRQFFCPTLRNLWWLLWVCLIIDSLSG